MTQPPVSREPCGLGVDIEPIARFTDPDLRLFHAAERDYCLGRGNPAESFAGRWCAKEAVVKACAPFGQLAPRDVQIYAGEHGAPYAVLPVSWQERGFEVLLSISHDETHAVAVAQLLRRTPL